MNASVIGIFEIVKYGLSIIKNVRQILLSTVRYLHCGLTGHLVSKEDEQKLFADTQGYWETTCSRCNYPLLLRKDPADKDNEYYMLMER